MLADAQSMAGMLRGLSELLGLGLGDGLLEGAGLGAETESVAELPQPIKTKTITGMMSATSDLV